MNTLDRIQGDVVVPMTSSQVIEEMRPILLVRLAQIGDPEEEFPVSLEFPISLRIGLFCCDYGVLLHLIFVLGKQERQVYARFDLSRAVAVEWLRMFCCVNSVLTGIVDRNLEGIAAIELNWPEADRLSLNRRIAEGLRWLDNIPSYMLDDVKTVNAFYQYEATHAKQQ
jgi:hypothetical protein